MCKGAQDVENKEALKEAKRLAATQAMELLKPMLREGQITRDQFKQAAQAATKELYRMLTWTPAELRTAVDAALAVLKRR